MKLARNIGLAAALALVAVACGDDDGGSSDTTAAPAATTAAAAETTAAATDTTAAATETTAAATETTAAGAETTAAATGEKTSVAILLPCAINDLSWCQAAYEGVKALETQGLIELQVVENAPFDAQGATRVMTGFAEEGVDVIIGHSFDYGAPINELAPNYPESYFVWQGSCNGFCDVAGPNVIDISMPMYEPAYLAGILAAGVSKTATFGTNSGYDIPTCRAAIEAFSAGGKEVTPELERLDTFLGTWIDSAKAKEATAAQAEQGADAFLACGNAGAFGMIQEVKERNLTGFGYIYDEASLAPANVLGSLSWKLEVPFGAIVNDVKAGTVKPWYEFLMKDGGFELTLNPDYSAAEISADAKAKYDEKLAAIMDGSFQVPYVPTAEG